MGDEEGRVGGVKTRGRSVGRLSGEPSSEHPSGQHPRGAIASLADLAAGSSPVSPTEVPAANERISGETALSEGAEKGQSALWDAAYAIYRRHAGYCPMGSWRTPGHDTIMAEWDALGRALHPEAVPRSLTHRPGHESEDV